MQIAFCMRNSPNNLQMTEQSNQIYHLTLCDAESTFFPQIHFTFT